MRHISFISKIFAYHADDITQLLKAGLKLPPTSLDLHLPLVARKSRCAPIVVSKKRASKLFRYVTIIFAAVLLAACADEGLTPGEGYIDVEGGKVWYKIVGSGDATRRNHCGADGWPC